jgi:hypothetical protein
MGSGGKIDVGPNNKECGMVACGDVEYYNEMSQTVKQGGGKNENLVEKQNKWVQLERGRR